MSKSIHRWPGKACCKACARKLAAIICGSALVGAALADAAMADGLSFGGGVTATSNYLSDGESQTGGKPALQPYFEISSGGIYGGIWGSNIRDADGNRAELDLYGGVRGDTAAGIGYDIAYTQHFYDKTRDFSAEITTALSYPVTDQLSLLGEVTYDLGEKAFGETIGLEYGLSDALTLSGEVGRSDPSSDTYVALGAGYDFSENYGIELQYQKPQSASGSVALALNYRFGAQGE
ncbi:MAG: TorF family putative porin [Pseudomonadota bacterium]